ncbi:MAG: sulfite exporter TauE/SafE family protein [Alphaproteobacteria bacterium]|nr:sulfite exporter TauE/SafE family protein [Alphaproteobacteria bacterium]
MSALALAFAAGVLSILSPCVLPLLPLVFGAAAAQRAGAIALAAGVAVSFVGIGLFVALIGFSLGIDNELIRRAGAIAMIGVGFVLALPRLQTRLAVAGGPVSDWANQRIEALAFGGLPGQLVIGLLLGAVWAPCVGPTLGAASLLAAQGSSLGAVAATMLTFAIGAAVPLVGLGLFSGGALARWRHRLAAGGATGKAGLGVALAVVRLMILSGVDKRVETALVDWSPAWLTALTTRF